MTPAAAVELSNVGMSYAASDGPVLALSDVDLNVERGQFVSLIGPSGCGKSTILRLVADIFRPTTGEITVSGGSPAAARLHHRYAFVFQEPVLLPWRTVADNVALPLEVAGRHRSEQKQIVDDVLERVGLSGFGGRLPRELSGGMRMRASLARALTGRPELLLMDEPFGALDEITRLEMNEELLRVWDEGQATVLFVTHSIDEAVFLSDRVVVLSARPGRVIADIEVPLERPRDYSVLSASTVFQDICQAVRSALHQARKAS